MQPAGPKLPRRADLGKAEQGVDKRSLNPAPTSSIPQLIAAGSYLVLNVASATRQCSAPSHAMMLKYQFSFYRSIVFANKTLFSVLKFRFVYALTLVHVLTTLVGMHIFAAMGLYERKPLPVRPLLSLAAAFVGYIVFWNVSLQINTVGFYQLSKICVTPAVLIFDALVSKRYPTRREICAILILCGGVALATITDKQVSTNFLGLGIAAAAIGFTAVYQVFAGSKQKQLDTGSMALMAGYTPIASIMLAVLVPIFEPMGFSDADPDTLLGFPYTLQAVAGIALTAILGLLVSLSTFLVIGATSSVTYNVVGHVKTVIVLGGGCLLFDEDMPAKRLLGICLALSGIFWYSSLKLKATATPGKERLNLSEKEPLLRQPADKLPDKFRTRSAASLDTLADRTNEYVEKV